MAEAEDAAAQAAEAVDSSAALSAYMADNDADEVKSTLITLRQTTGPPTMHDHVVKHRSWTARFLSLLLRNSGATPPPKKTPTKK